MTARMVPLVHSSTCRAPGCVKSPTHIVFDGQTSLGKFCEFHADLKVHSLNTYRTMVDRVQSREVSEK